MGQFCNIDHFQKMQKVGCLGPNYVYFCVLGSQIRKFGPRPPMIFLFLKTINVSELSHQYASNESSMTFQLCCKLKLCLFSCFGPNCPNMEIRPQTPRFLHFFENDQCFRIVSSIHFQRALNDYQTIRS